jgi:hypothetical protein
MTPVMIHNGHSMYRDSTDCGLASTKDEQSS